MQEAEKQQIDGILVSVVVPVYNVEAFLPQCIDSLLAQTHSNLEIILVDDGSTDSSGLICDRYAAQDNRVRVIHQQNGGLSAARNTGIAAATGEYIGFVDSDDFVAPEMYCTLLDAATLGDGVVATCGRYTTDEAGVVIGTVFALPEYKRFSIVDAMNEILVNGQLDVAAWDKLYRKDLFDGIVFPVGEINEDAAIIFHILSKAQEVVHVGVPMYYYRGRNGSITKSGYKPNKVQALDHAQEISIFVEQRFPQLKSSCKKYVAFLCCQLLSLMLKDPMAPKYYPEHYKRYINGLRKEIWYLVSNPNVSMQWKLRGVLLFLNLYGFLYALVKK